MATPTQGYWLDGKRLPSVTTILGRFKESGALIKWGYGQGRENGRESALNEMIEKARMLRGAGYWGEPGELDPLFGEHWSTRDLPYVPVELYDKSGVSQQAALAGTVAHDLIEQHILTKGEVQDWGAFVERFPAYAAVSDDVKRRALNSYAQFQKWLANSGLKITHTEMGLVSKTHRFGGTLDAVGVDRDGDVVLIDWKTSNAVYGDYLFQLAAYALLLEENHPELSPRGFHLLRVAKETADFGHLYWGELDEQKLGFIKMRELYDICARTNKRVG